MPDAARLSEVLDGYEKILVFCHMNPDPDSIASGLAMQLLLETRFGKEVQLVYRGIIGRAQNREMVRRLAPRLRRFRDIDTEDFDAAVLVDAQPQFGFEPGQEQENDVPTIACIDHHPYVDSTDEVPYHDVRPGLGATSTIMTGYLRLFSVEPSQAVATALYYGIKTDTLGLTRRTCDEDRDAYEFLSPLVDHDALSHIESPPIARVYFNHLKRAMEDASLYGNVIVSNLGRLPYPDMVAEIADLFLRVEGVAWSVCMGHFNRKVYISVRTEDARGDAGVLIRQVVGDLGQAGGHNTMAAARIVMESDKPIEYEKIRGILQERLVDMIGNDETAVELLDV